MAVSTCDQECSSWIHNKWYLRKIQAKHIFKNWVKSKCASELIVRIGWVNIFSFFSFTLISSKQQQNLQRGNINFAEWLLPFKNLTLFPNKSDFSVVGGETLNGEKKGRKHANCTAVCSSYGIPVIFWLGKSPLKSSSLHNTKRINY